MSETVQAYPLQWPVGWKRSHSLEHGRFGKRERNGTSSYASLRDLSVSDATLRVRGELERMGVKDHDVVISTNLKLRLDGWPRSDQGNPADPGVAVYWRDRRGETRCMAIDRYVRVADNIAAISATLEAMRAIERHGGASILDRAFTGFAALPAPASAEAWHVVFGVPAHMPTDQVREAYRRARRTAHPDGGGSAESFETVQRAWAQFCADRGIDHG